MEQQTNPNKSLVPPVPISSNSMDYSRLQAQLDDIKSALYSVAEKVGKSSANFDQISSDLSKTNSSLKIEIQKLDDAAVTQQAFATLVSDNVEKKIEELFKLQLLKSSNSPSYLAPPVPPETNTEVEISPQTIALISKSMEAELDKKLKLLAEIDSEMLKRINDNYVLLDSIRSNAGAAVVRSSAFSNYPNPPAEPEPILTPVASNKPQDLSKVTESLNNLVSKFQSDSEFKSKIEIELLKQRDSIANLFNAQNQQIVTLFNKALENAEEAGSSVKPNDANLVGSIEDLTKKQSEQADVFSSTLLKILEYTETIQKKLDEQKTQKEPSSSTTAPLTDSIQTSAVLSEIATKQQEQYQAISQALLLLDSNVKQLSLQSNIASISGTTTNPEVQDNSKQFETLSKSLEQLQKFMDEKFQTIPSTIDKVIDDKLVNLAKMNVEMLNQLKETNETTKLLQTQLNQKELIADSVAFVSTEVKELNSKITEQDSALQKSLSALKDQVAISQTQLFDSLKNSNKPDSTISEFATESKSKFELLESSLSKIIDNQNKQNQVFSDALAGLIDSTDLLTKQITEINSSLKTFDTTIMSIKSRVESNQVNETEIAKHVEQEISKKLGN